MRRFFFVFLFVALGASAQAQGVLNPATAKIEFVSLDHANTRVTQYQAYLFLAAVVPGAQGVNPIRSGPALAKALASPVTGVANTYELTFTQMALNTPVCAAAPCPVYTVELIAIGPGGANPWSVVGESDSFTLAPQAQTLPAAPSNVKVKSL